MNKQDWENIHAQVKSQLDGCVRFWLNNGMDKTNGGVYTCLDERGAVYSTDKSVWMQGRCAWTFAHLCNRYGPQEDWQQAAKSCLDFLEAHCINREKGNRMYFTVTAEGAPLRQRRYCFSEAFYTMANAEYYALTHEPVYLARARAAYELIWKLNNGLVEDPVGLGAKTMPETRSGRSLADPMIYLNLCSVLLRCDDTPEHQALYHARARQSIQTVLDYHHKPELGMTLETVGKDGEFWPELSSGRVVNPGHDMECAWFMLDYASAQGREDWCQKAAEIFDMAYQAGWDREYGGLLYYVDALGKPPEAYEHDMKLWWPHNEMAIAALMLYQKTGEARYRDIFADTWAYAMQHLADNENGEWYGYLRRDGQPTRPAAKGSTFKGPFHLPRMLILVDRLLNDIVSSAE